MIIANMLTSVEIGVLFFVVGLVIGIYLVKLDRHFEEKREEKREE